MSYIPDCRKPYETDYRTGQIDTNKPNPYYEGNLRYRDKNIMDGYDLCVSTIDSVFDDLDEFECPDTVAVADAVKVIRSFKEYVLMCMELNRDQIIVGTIDCYSDKDGEEDEQS